MGLSATFPVCKPPKQARFGPAIPSVEPPDQGKEVGYSLANISGLELLLEIEIEGNIHQVLVDSGTSLSVIKERVSTAEIEPTQTAARGTTGNKLRVLR